MTLKGGDITSTRYYINEFKSEFYHVIDNNTLGSAKISKLIK